jgi:hypothetical protein
MNATLAFVAAFLLLSGLLLRRALRAKLLLPLLRRAR